MDEYFRRCRFRSIRYGRRYCNPLHWWYYAINDYLETAVQDLELNYNSTNAYALLLANTNGWSGRIGVSYAMDKNTESDTEEYSEFFPNIGFMKTYTLPSGTVAVFDAYVGNHASTSNKFPMTAWIT